MQVLCLSPEFKNLGCVQSLQIMSAMCVHLRSFSPAPRPQVPSLEPLAVVQDVTGMSRGYSNI